MKKTKLLITILFLSFKAFSQNCYEDLMVVAQDRGQQDDFGGSVSVSGDYAVIAARWNDFDELGGDYKEKAGAVYVYQKYLGKWTFLQKLVASDRIEKDGFGWSVDIDRDRIAVGAWNADTSTHGWGGAGAAYIFKRNSSNVWIEEQVIRASDGTLSDRFGAAIGISDSTIIVGAYGEEEDILGGNNIQNSGSAYVFELSSLGLWYEKQKVTASDRFIKAKFGFPVSIDKNTILCGATGDLSNRGAAYLFERNSSGFFVQTKKIIADSAIANEYFGSSLDVDSNTIVVGTPSIAFVDSNAPFNYSYGVVYTYHKNSLAGWDFEMKLKNKTPHLSRNFGTCIKLDYPYMIVSSLAGTGICGTDTSLNTGVVYHYKHQGTNQWIETDKFIKKNGLRNDFFGHDIALDGNNVLIGDSREERDTSGQNLLSNAGAAYFYTAASYNVGINENANPINFQLFPNPNKGVFNLQFDKELKINSLFITDINGRLIKEIIPQKTLTYEISFEGVSGVYFLNLITKSDRKTIKLIKN
jgi:hypothetical protein